MFPSSLYIPMFTARINTLQVHPTDSNILVAAFGGGKHPMMLFDVRHASSKQRKAAPINSIDIHNKSINGAAVSPDGKYLVSVSQDNTIKVSTDFLLSSSTSDGAPSVPAKRKAPPAAGAKPYSMYHDNLTGRWLCTFRPVFDPKHAHSFLLGSMAKPRCMEAFTITSSTSTCTTASSGTATNAIGMSQVVLRAEMLASVCSRNAVHPTQHAILGANSSGKVHLLR